MADLQNGNPSIQASNQSYNPYSEQSVVLNSHSIYGPLILNDPDVDLPIGAGGGIVE